MDIEKTYKVGDKVVCGGYLYRIFKVDSEGDVIFFKPHFKDNKNNTTVRKIPIQNLPKTTMRDPINKKEAKQLLDLLKAKQKKNNVRDLIEAKEILMQNSALATVNVIKWLWSDKQDEEKAFTLSQKRIWDVASERLIEEIANANDISLEQAEKVILRSLKASS